MDNFNYQFFEEFSKLDKICVSIYQAEGGTLDYLARMWNVSVVCADMIPHWKEDMDQLYRYRSIFQALAQSADSFKELACSSADVDWLRDFRVRIMERRDPLALLQLQGYRAEDEAKQRLEDRRSDGMPVYYRDSRDRNINAPLLVAVLLASVILTCLLCVLLLNRL